MADGDKRYFNLTSYANQRGRKKLLKKIKLGMMNLKAAMIKIRLNTDLKLNGGIHVITG